jgi:phage gpG-like protein
MTTTIDNLSDFNPVLDDLQRQVNEMDYEEILKGSQQDLAEYETGIFAGEFDSNLNPWAPLAPSTIKRKGHDRILLETGALRESLVHVGGPGNVAETASRGMIFGTEVPYAIFHQTGTRRMPARPPVGISEETLDKLCNRIADETVRQLAASGSS